MTPAVLDTTTIALFSAACSFAIAGVTVVGFWMRFSDRVTKAEAKADAAENRAAEADNLAAEAHNRITDQIREFARYREKVAEEYSSIETVRQIETKMTQAIDRLGDTLGARIDRLIEKRG